MSLPENLIIEKNKLNAKYPWLLLLKLAKDEGESYEIVYRFVRDHPDVTFQGELYTGFNFDLGLIQQSIEGRILDTTLSVSGVSVELHAELEALDGAVDFEVTITVVHADNLGEDHSELEWVFDVLATHIGALSIDFTIGAPSPLLQRFLTQVYFADFCSYDEYKGPRCQAVSAFTTCPRRRVDCRARNNSNRFGGCPGLRVDGVRFLS